jgi:hypothetical protein
MSLLPPHSMQCRGARHYIVPNLMLTSTLGPNTLMELAHCGWYAHDEWSPWTATYRIPARRSRNRIREPRIWGWYIGEIGKPS